MATSLTLENDSSLAQGYLKVNGSTAATLTTSGITANLTGNVTGNLSGSLTAGGSLTLATAQTASGTSVDFTGIPSWVKRIGVMFNSVSMSGNNNILIQIGSSGTPQTTGYFSNSGYIFGTSVTAVNSTSGFIVYSNNSSNTIGGLLLITKLSGNIWVSSGNFVNQSQHIQAISGQVTLSGDLNVLTIKSSVADTFDAGTINISYEG